MNTTTTPPRTARTSAASSDRKDSDQSDGEPMRSSQMGTVVE